MVRDVVIIGGGIGGLTLAAALGRAGIATRVIEKRSRANRPGAGIVLQGNALRALDMIGLADACIAAGYGYTLMKTRDFSGRLVDETPAPRIFGADRPAGIGIMRTALADCLENAAISGGAVIEFETTVESIEQQDDRVDLTLSTGERLTADLVVGADGAYSATRTAIFGDAFNPAYCGQGAVRCTAPRPEEMDGITFYRGKNGEAVGAMPLSEEQCYYFVLESGERRGFLDGQQTAEIWKRHMEQFTAPELVMTAQEATASSPVGYRPFDVLMMPPPWHRGRVVLLGDAVHSMSPQLASGGGMAIEDAIVLGQVLDGASDIETALSEYARRREPRVRPIFETSLAICQMEQNPSLEGLQKGLALFRKGWELLAEPI